MPFPCSKAVTADCSSDVVQLWETDCRREGHHLPGLQGLLVGLVRRETCFDFDADFTVKVSDADGRPDRLQVSLSGEKELLPVAVRSGTTAPSREDGEHVPGFRRERRERRQN